MSYGAGAALQAAVFQRLAGDPALAALVGEAVFDAAPGGPLPPLYVTLGPEVVRDRSDATHGGAEHEFAVEIVTQAAGFAGAKAAAAAVSDALVDADLALSRGRLVRLDFWTAKAVRVGAGAMRQITLTFRAFVEDS